MPPTRRDPPPSLFSLNPSYLAQINSTKSRGNRAIEVANRRAKFLARRPMEVGPLNVHRQVRQPFVSANASRGEVLIRQIRRRRTPDALPT